MMTYFKMRHEGLAMDYDRYEEKVSVRTFCCA